MPSKATIPRLARLVRSYLGKFDRWQAADRSGRHSDRVLHEHRRAFDDSRQDLIRALVAGHEPTPPEISDELVYFAGLAGVVVDGVLYLAIEDRGGSRPGPPDLVIVPLSRLRGL